MIDDIVNIGQMQSEELARRPWGWLACTFLTTYLNESLVPRQDVH